MLIYYLSSLIFSNFEFLFLTCAKPDWRNEKVKGEKAVSVCLFPELYRKYKYVF